MQCPACQCENKAEARFCKQCGHELSAQAAGSTCAHCAAPLRPGAAFCGRCGKPASAAQSPITPASAPVEPPAAGTCAHCRAPLKPGAAFCGRCGSSTDPAKGATPPKDAPPGKTETVKPPPTRADIPAADTCRQCAAPLKPGAVFCGHCGTPSTGTPAHARDPDVASESVPPARTAAPAPAPRPTREPAAGTSPSAAPHAHEPSPHASVLSTPTRRSSLVPVLAIAAIVLLLLLGGGLWWRMHERAAPAASGNATATAPGNEPTPAAPAVDTAPTGAEQAPDADISAIAGDWVARADASARPLPSALGVLRIAADRVRLRGETASVRYRQEANWIGIHVIAEDPDATGPARLRVQAIDADHLLLDEAGVRHDLLRKGSAAERDALAAAAPIPEPPPTPRPAPPAPAAPDPLQAAIRASLREGRQCMAQKKYDCAISSANAVLRLAARNAEALAMKREAEAAQAQALSEIEIR